jgi:hypothetical protein
MSAPRWTRGSTRPPTTSNNSVRSLATVLLISPPRPSTERCVRLNTGSGPASARGSPVYDAMTVSRCSPAPDPRMSRDRLGYGVINTRRFRPSSRPVVRSARRSVYKSVSVFRRHSAAAAAAAAATASSYVPSPALLKTTTRSPIGRVSPLCR